MDEPITMVTNLLLIHTSSIYDLEKKKIKYSINHFDDVFKKYNLDHQVTDIDMVFGRNVCIKLVKREIEK